MMELDLFSDPIHPTEPALPFALPADLAAQVRWDEALHGHWIALPQGELFYAREFISPKISDRTVEYFLENAQGLPANAPWASMSADELAAVVFDNIPWQQDFIHMYGKKLPLPRLTSWHGDAGKSYTYSGIRSEPNPWNKGLDYLKGRVEAVAGTAFNSVLLNWYRSGEDHLNWHADDEPELGRNPIIASLNFGESRDFQLRHNAQPKQLITVPLHHGSFLLMRGALQHHWQHKVPKRAKVKGSRFNLTFRHIQPNA